MRRTGFCLSLLLVSVLGHSQPARSQGIGEMGGAYAASSGQTHGLMNSGTTGALSGPMSSAVKSINSSTAGAAGGSSTGGGSTSSLKIKNTPLKDGDEPPTPAQTAKKAGEVSNKLYSDAQAKFKAGDYENADKLFRQSLYYRESIWGAKDPAVPRIYDILGDIARKRAAPIEAEKCYNKELMTQIKQYGQGDYQLTPVLNKLGALYLDTFKFSDAVNSYSQVYQLTSRKYGDDNELTVQAAINLGKSYLGDEDFRQASNLLHEYATKLDKGPDSNLQELSSVLELYQTALQKTNQTDALQRVQTRAQEVTDLLAAQKMKTESKAAGGEAGTDAGATADKPAGEATKSHPADAAKPAAADVSNTSAAEAAKPAAVDAAKSSPANTAKPAPTEPAKPAAKGATSKK